MQLQEGLDLVINRVHHARRRQIQDFQARQRLDARQRDVRHATLPAVPELHGRFLQSHALRLVYSQRPSRKQRDLRPDQQGVRLFVPQLFDAAVGENRHHFGVVVELHHGESGAAVVAALLFHELLDVVLAEHGNVLLFLGAAALLVCLFVVDKVVDDPLSTVD